LDGREAEEDQGEEEEDCECGEISTINSSDTTSIHFLFRCRCLRLDAPLQRNKRKVITGRKEGIARVSLCFSQRQLLFPLFASTTYLLLERWSK